MTGKRELAARVFGLTGVTRVLENLPKRAVLLVLNYHRIGDARKTSYDPRVFSATAEQFDAQIGYLKTHFHMATATEAVAMVTGKAPLRTSVLITFDDGYLDNYTLAFPVLRARDVQGVFFLPTGLVGSHSLPYWDVIAYIVKGSPKAVVRLTYPRAVAIDLQRVGLDRALRKVLQLGKDSAVAEPDRFIAELSQACEAPAPRHSAKRRFLNWEEAREMHRGGMAIGSHAHSHQIMAKLSLLQQCEEVSRSRSMLERQLDSRIDIFAYPDGGEQSFSRDTMEVLRENGYRAAFSLYGGTNCSDNVNAFDVRRWSVALPSLSRFRVQTNLAVFTGTRWW